MSGPIVRRSWLPNDGDFFFEAAIHRLMPETNEPVILELSDEFRHRLGVCLGRLIGEAPITRIFRTGSRTNRTGVRARCDHDYFVVLRRSALPPPPDPGMLLLFFEHALAECVGKARVRVDPPAVIMLGTGSEPTIDLVPALPPTPDFLPEAPDYAVVNGRRYAAYAIAPDDQRGARFELSSPEAHLARLEQHDVQWDGRARKLIRLLKAWKYANELPIVSYYLELTAMDWLSQQREVHGYSPALCALLRRLATTRLAPVKDPNRPSHMMPACYNEVDLARAFDPTEAAGRACKQVERLEAASKPGEALRVLETIYQGWL
jgi:hypothetical protein